MNSKVATSFYRLPFTVHRLLQHLDHVILVRINADLAGDGQRLFYDVLRGEFGIFQQRTRRGLRIGAAAADCGPGCYAGFGWSWKDGVLCGRRLDVQPLEVDSGYAELVEDRAFDWDRRECHRCGEILCRSVSA